MCEKMVAPKWILQVEIAPKVARNSRYCKCIMNVYLNVTSIGKKLQCDKKIYMES